MVQQLDVRQLHERLGTQGIQLLILDVREPWEYQICALPGSTHIPMGQIATRVGELPRDGDIVVVCHHGNRSQRVAEFLGWQGYARVYNLSGGVDAWAREIDLAMPVY